jgi:hypothetical protein
MLSKIYKVTTDKGTIVCVGKRYYCINYLNTHPYMDLWLSPLKVNKYSLVKFTSHLSDLSVGDYSKANTNKGEIDLYVINIIKVNDSTIVIGSVCKDNVPIYIQDFLLTKLNDEDILAPITDGGNKPNWDKYLESNGANDLIPYWFRSMRVTSNIGKSPKDK